MIQSNPSAIYEGIKSREDIGVGAEMLRAEALLKTGAQIIANDTQTRELRMYRDAGYICNILEWKLGDYGWGEWLTCLNLKLFPEYTVPVMSRMLSVNIFVPGFYYRGEILWRVWKLEGSVWTDHPDWRQYFAGLLEALFHQYSDDDLKRLLDEYIYNELKNIFVNNKISCEGSSS